MRSTSGADRRQDRTESGPNVFTIPQGRPFLDHLARALLEGNLPVPGGVPPTPQSLADITLILPTRRATRALQEAFLRVSGGRAMLLPRIIPISEGQEDLSLLADAASGLETGLSGSDIAPAIGELERRLALTCLVQRWAQASRRTGDDDSGYLSGSAPTPAGTTPAQASQLAKELAGLMDTIETENVSYERLAGLVPENLTQHWQQTLEFLKIVTEFWPAHLALKEKVSPAARRNSVILAEARRLATHPQSGPVIVAGVTGSVPATAELMKAVASLRNGAIVLPALDTILDAESWAAITGKGEDDPGFPEHPQYGLKRLLGGLGLTREDVAILPGAEPAERQQARLALVSEAMRPASTTGAWAELAASKRAGELAAALDGLTLIEAPNAQDEAEAIALILREAVETPGRTAALVSPDRLLARRVTIRLEAWGIKVDDSAGRPFRKTVPGAFLDLVIEAAAKRFAPAEVMALLKHPLTRLGLEAFPVRRAGRALELAAFRGTYLGIGLDGIEAALERAAINAKPGGEERVHPAVRRLFDADWDGARDLIARLRIAFAPLVEAMSEKGQRPLSAFAEAHRRTAEALAEVPVPDSAAPGVHEGKPMVSPVWAGEAGQTARAFFDQLFEPGLIEPGILAADYPDLYRSLLASENVRLRVPIHPRLFIWGPFEARLQQADIMVLGSLNDNTWPESADPGPWLNRSMRRALGLPSPEEKIGHAAHDFTSFLGAERVIMTRALKVDGVPTVPSRWLMRLKALLDGLGLKDQLDTGETWLGWARTRDSVARVEPAKQPRPCPAIALRPRKLSVSRIETWISNPYAIFAREILRLEPLPPLGREPDAAQRGSIIHAALAEFARKHPKSLPPGIKEELMAIARAEFRRLAAHPRVAAFWMPRFERFAQWFAETEPQRRFGIERVIAETPGDLVIGAPAGPFTLTARADRIDTGPAGLVITDYKTGMPPSKKKVAAGLAPQLPLEAAIAEKGKFAGLTPGAATALRYISVSGGEPAGTEIEVSNGNAPTLANEALGGLSRLVQRFDDPATPYAPKRRAAFSYDYDDYAHLARVAEWSADAASPEED